MADENHKWHHIDDVEIPHYKCWCGREFLSSLQMRKHRDSGECDAETVEIEVGGESGEIAQEKLQAILS